ncbi:unnamed protein product [Paramecium sonneborni]|uniref:Uncharacterized protein n=1 Tax=Paramecium sonneborni TaxID=65129 RepID=A0A8S1PVZ9_9CILI|nr:unnamed protein product [Paramecium sonneborni]
MQFDNLFGYEEQQQQSQLQLQLVDNLQEQFKQLKPQNILSMNLKCSKKQRNKIIQFKQQMCLKKPKSRSEIEIKNQMTKQQKNSNNGPNAQEENSLLTLFLIEQQNEALKDILSKVDQIITTQKQSFNQNKQQTQNEEKNLEYLQNWLVSCLKQFKQLESFYPEQFIKKQIDQSNLSLKLDQKENGIFFFLDTQISLPGIKFSEISKNKTIKLDKFRTSASSKFYGIAVCEQSLSQEGISKFAFKINKIDGNIAIGVCNKDKLGQQNFINNNFQNTQGLYLLQNYGGMYSNQEIGILQGQPFEFQESNIIIVIVNFQQKTIKWKKFNHQSEFMINFDIKYDSQPCVLFSKLSSFNKISKVSIVNPKTLRIIDGCTYI